MLLNKTVLICLTHFIQWIVLALSELTLFINTLTTQYSVQCEQMIIKGCQPTSIKRKDNSDETWSKIEFWNRFSQGTQTFKFPSRVLRAFTRHLSTSRLSALSLLGGSLSPLIQRPVRTRDDRTKSGSNSPLVSLEESRSVTCLASYNSEHNITVCTYVNTTSQYVPTWTQHHSMYLRGHNITQQLA